MRIWLQKNYFVRGDILSMTQFTCDSLQQNKDLLTDLKNHAPHLRNKSRYCTLMVASTKLPRKANKLNKVFVSIVLHILRIFRIRSTLPRTQNSLHIGLAHGNTPPRFGMGVRGDYGEESEDMKAMKTRNHPCLRRDSNSINLKRP